MKALDAMLLAVFGVAVILAGDLLSGGADSPASRAAGGPAVRWRYIVLHHTGEEGASPSSPIHRAYGGGEEPFHMVVGPTDGAGVDLSARWLAREPLRHTAQPNLDGQSISVAVAGDFDRNDLPPDEAAGLVAVLRALQKEFGIPTDRIIAHRQADPFDSRSLAQGRSGRTTCPGARIDVRRIRRMVDGIE